MASSGIGIAALLQISPSEAWQRPDPAPSPLQFTTAPGFTSPGPLLHSTTTTILGTKRTRSDNSETLLDCDNVGQHRHAHVDMAESPSSSGLGQDSSSSSSTESVSIGEPVAPTAMMQVQEQQAGTIPSTTDNETAMIIHGTGSSTDNMVNETGASNTIIVPEIPSTNGVWHTGLVDTGLCCTPPVDLANPGPNQAPVNTGPLTSLAPPTTLPDSEPGSTTSNIVMTTAASVTLNNVHPVNQTHADPTTYPPTHQNKRRKTNGGTSVAGGDSDDSGDSGHGPDGQDGPGVDNHNGQSGRSTNATNDENSQEGPKPQKATPQDREAPIDLTNGNYPRLRHPIYAHSTH